MPPDPRQAKRKIAPELLRSQCARPRQASFFRRKRYSANRNAAKAVMIRNRNSGVIFSAAYTPRNATPITITTAPMMPVQFSAKRFSSFFHVSPEFFFHSGSSTGSTRGVMPRGTSTSPAAAAISSRTGGAGSGSGTGSGTRSGMTLASGNAMAAGSSWDTTPACFSINSSRVSRARIFFLSFLDLTRR